MSKKYLFIGTDRTVNAGDADAFKALCQSMDENGVRADMMFCRMEKNADAAYGGDFRQLPLDNDRYDALPLFSEGFLNGLKLDDNAETHIVGIGQNTLDSLVESIRLLPHARTFYMTHLVEKKQIEKIRDAGITVMTPSFKDVPLEDIVKLSGVPSSNTQKSCESHFDAFMQTANGSIVSKILAEKSPFAVVIVNAGSEFGGVHVPYTEQEAAEHGKILGELLPPETALLVVHGGPRNLGDIAVGHDGMAAFRRAYEAAQVLRGKAPLVLEERFVRNLPYNAIKASYIMAQQGNCLFFVSSCDGRGTAEGALALVPPSVPKAMFRSKVSLTHEAPLLHELHAKGLGIFAIGEEGVRIENHPEATIRSQEDASFVIINLLNLI